MWGAVIGAGASLLGSYLSSKNSASAQESATNATIQANRESYQNAVQWKTEDLKKAGLNPILAATNLSNVGYPQSSAASYPAFSDPGPGMSNAITGYSARQLANAQVNSVNADVAKKNEEINMIKEQTNLIREQMASTAQQRWWNGEQQSWYLNNPAMFKAWMTGNALSPGLNSASNLIGSVAPKIKLGK